MAEQFKWPTSIDRLRELVAAGLTLAEIGAALRPEAPIRSNAVSKALIRHGIPYPEASRLRALSEAQKRRELGPDYYAALREKARPAMKTAEFSEKMRRKALAYYAAMTPEQRKGVSEKISRAWAARSQEQRDAQTEWFRKNLVGTAKRWVAWCPDAYRAEYETLRRKLNSAPAARAMILEKIGRDTKRANEQRAEQARRDRLDFSRQLERARAGAQLSTVQPIGRGALDHSPQSSSLGDL